MFWVCFLEGSHDKKAPVYNQLTCMVLRHTYCFKGPQTTVENQHPAYTTIYFPPHTQPYAIKAFVRQVSFFYLDI